jgi:hypothetical protein
VPRALTRPFGLEALGFSERERNLLDAVDGRAPLSVLGAQAGLSRERVHQVFAVARMLRLVELLPAVEGAIDEEAALARKYDQVHQADYFAILEVPRSADAEAVRRAHLRLSEQFDPLKFAAHPDPGLLQKAQAVYRHVKDAARALRDDARRADYARHLLD